MGEKMELIQQLRGRAAFLRDKGRVKSPQLMEQAAAALEAALSAQPAERQGEAVAWLHTVTQGDGETDHALSFSPDSFPLDTQLGFRSLGCRPLGYIDTHLTQPAQAVDVGAIREVIADMRNQTEVWDSDVKRWTDKLTAATPKDSNGAEGVGK